MADTAMAVFDRVLGDKPNQLSGHPERGCANYR
ncbi:hypothetical protein LNQ52_07605 [Klebsiella pneumoniae subsp. pneumoniae]|nr:hypothetical protein [Klebsiella pneumoniae subsp. pneumoniae]